ncbi:MAG: hypothetical protein U0835_25820 [Isosphaeraceae bacterium]
MKLHPRRRRDRRLSLDRLEERCLLAGSLGAVWVGQDAHDFAGGPSPGAGNAVQDIHIALSGLPGNRSVSTVNVVGHGGGQWTLGIGNYTPFTAYLSRASGATTADVYIEPYQVETGREFYVALQYDDGTSDSVYFAGGKADPNLRMASSVVSLTWAGQDGQDLTGLGAGVGPDGYIDAHIRLGNLSASTDAVAVTVTRSSGTGWASGINPGLLNNAEFLRTSGSTTADLYFSPDVNLVGQTLTVSVTYSDGKVDRNTLVAGSTSPGYAAPAPSQVNLVWNTINVRWAGQDGLNLLGPGDVHLAVDGIPAGRTVNAAVLSNGVGTDWSYVRPGSGLSHSDPYAAALGFRAGSDSTRADFTFQPVRDELGATLTLRLQLDDGRILVRRFSGGSADVGLRAADIASSVVVAHPGDDLNDLANRYGTVRLTGGLYLMTQPLILNRPVTIQGDPGATLLFAQDGLSAPWSAAIKVRASHTTLDGFAVRFAGPVRWASGISYGPAVVGMTDNLDPWNPDPLVDMVFTNLDVQSPPVASGFEEAPSLFRLNNASNGRVAYNRLKGGVTEFLGGPWVITGNTYLGTVPNTFAYSAFAGHYTHDVTISNNTVQPVGPSGKTWRFLVMTQNGNADAVVNNKVVGIGAMDSDTIECPNAYELLLTEAYRLHYEGQTSWVSPDGWVVQIPAPQADQARTGDVLAILSGPEAGQWRMVAQVINANTYLLDAPITPGKFAVSLATGFANESYVGNTIDATGSTQSFPLVLAGNQFGATVIGNRIVGGDSFRITAYPSETPNVWGWTHAPFLGATITGNTVENSMRGGTLGVEHNEYSKANGGRTYFSGTFQNNIGVWSSAFLAKRTALGVTSQPVLATVGDGFSVDPVESILTASGNQITAPSTVVSGSTFRVMAGIYNGSSTRNLGVSLPGVGAGVISTASRNAVTAPEVRAAGTTATSPPRVVIPRGPTVTVTPPRTTAFQAGISRIAQVLKNQSKLLRAFEKLPATRFNAWQTRHPLAAMKLNAVRTWVEAWRARLPAR